LIGQAPHAWLYTGLSRMLFIEPTCEIAGFTRAGVKEVRLSSPTIGLAPARISGFCPTSPRSRTRVLPTRNERSFITMYMSTALDLNFRVYSLLKHRAKNDLLLDALTDFLNRGTSCAVAHDQGGTPQERSKTRVTFVVTLDLQVRLDNFIKSNHCNQTCAVTAALIHHLKQNRINPFRDHSGNIMRVLTRV
jgi:hypothetical protein